MPKKMALFISLVALMAILVTSLAVAQSGGPFDLTWSTIDGRGGISSGGSYALGGTSGQPDAGVMNGGPFALVGGFWVGTDADLDVKYKVYLPSITR